MIHLESRRLISPLKTPCIRLRELELVGTMHTICKVWSLNPDHHKKKPCIIVITLICLLNNSSIFFYEINNRIIVVNK